MNNNKTTNILLGIMIVVLIAIGIIMATNQNRNSYRNDMMRNDDSTLNRQNEISDQVQSNTNKQVTTIQDTVKPVVKTPISQTNNSISSDLKTYTNSKYGFSFQYPSSWDQNGDLVEVQDLQGNITNVEIYFKDTKSSSNLLVAYRLAPRGAQAYQYLVSDYNASQGSYKTNKKQILVAGITALEANTTTTIDGRGNAISPIRKVIVDFLDKQQTGSFELQFSTNASGDSEVVKFNQVLSSFKFI